MARGKRLIVVKGRKDGSSEHALSGAPNDGDVGRLLHGAKGKGRGGNEA